MLKLIKPYKYQYIYLILISLTIIALLIINVYFQICHSNLKLVFKNKTYNFKIVNLLWIIFGYILIVISTLAVIKIIQFIKINSAINNNLINEPIKFNWLHGIGWAFFIIYCLPVCLIFLALLILLFIWDSDYLLFWGPSIGGNSDEE